MVTFLEIRKVSEIQGNQRNTGEYEKPVKKLILRKHKTLRKIVWPCLIELLQPNFPREIIIYISERYFD